MNLTDLLFSLGVRETILNLADLQQNGPQNQYCRVGAPLQLVSEGNSSKFGRPPLQPVGEGNNSACE